MNRNDIVDSLGRIDEEMIHDVEELRGKGEQEASLELQKTHGSWRGLALAACLILVFVSGFGLLKNGLGGMGSSGGGGSDSGGGMIYMEYAGPIMPLTTPDDMKGIEAVRRIDFDFSNYDGYMTAYSEWRVQHCRVRDEYTITNGSGEDRTLKLYYPFEARLSDRGLVPDVYVNGETIDTELNIGPVNAGSGEDEEEDPVDFIDDSDMFTWEGVKKLLDEGYLGLALEAYPSIDEKVTVYELSNMRASRRDDSYHYYSMRAHLDFDKTKLLNYGFDGYERNDENGFINLSAPITIDEEQNGVDSAYLILIGGDVSDYELKAATTKDPNKELEDAECKVARYETTLDEVMTRIIEDYLDNYAKDLASYERNSLAFKISQEEFKGLVAEMLYNFGYLANSSEGYLDEGFLEDILSDTMNWKRVIYSGFEVTVPAGGSVDVKFDMIKEPSINFGGDGIDSNGYDMLTRAGSKLDFSAQTASISNTEYIGIVDQNFGFDLDQGVTEVRLDPAEERYYMDIARLGEDGEFFMVEDHRSNWFVGWLCLGLLFVGLTGLGILLVSKLIDHFAKKLNMI